MGRWSDRWHGLYYIYVDLHGEFFVMSAWFGLFVWFFLILCKFDWCVLFHTHTHTHTRARAREPHESGVVLFQAFSRLRKRLVSKVYSHSHGLLSLNVGS